jgi:uncharacterized membrane protein
VIDIFFLRAVWRRWSAAEWKAAGWVEVVIVVVVVVDIVKEEVRVNK